MDTIEHTLLVVAIAIGFTANSLFAGSSTPLFQETTELIYPVSKVTTLPCRAQMKPWSELSDECKIDLPLIKGADYDKYHDAMVDKDTSFQSIYTVLRGATYNGQWDMDKGDHAGVDIASAKWTPLVAIAHGVVTFAGEQAGYGNVVKIMFRYQGTTYHAVYAHMDKILVTKGYIVKQGEQIWTVGNSGSVSGWLGWNHVHFEIDKDNKWSPLFYYLWCPALVDEKKSFTEITNGWLCRSYREKAQLDPIAFIEKSKGKQVVSTLALVPEVEKNSEVVIEKPASVSPQFIELKKIDPSKLSKDALMFVKDWDIQVVGTYNSSMKVNEQGQLQLFVTKKWTAKSFDGALPAAFAIISPTDGITSSLKSISYLSNGTQQRTFTATKKWSQKLAISLWWQTIAVIELTVSAQ